MKSEARAELTRKIENKEAFSLSFKFADNEYLMVINSVIAKILTKMDHLFLLNSFVTITREVVVNAQKANAKRIYFIKNNLDINNPQAYEEGMKLFKENVIGEFDQVEEDLKNSDFIVKMAFTPKSGSMDIKVVNNTPILPTELQRINHRIQKAMQYSDFTDAYDEIQDDTEGAGLGIVLTILFLKNMGIDPRTFKIETDGKATQTSLHIPNELRPSMITTKFKTDILKEIEGIPTFPENVTALLQMCSNPDVVIDQVATKIQEDPALSTDVIKLSNSAGFFPTSRVESVSTAVMTIGLKNVEAILMASNARKILDKRYSSFEEIWKHCNKAALYARHIALKNKLPIVEQCFIGGLLHDLGKIILLSTNMDLVKRIAEQIKDKRIVTSTIMEEISVGLSHSTIGGLISEQWQFPDYLIESIKYHHDPLSASDDYKNIAYTVYLANMFCGIEDRKYTYFYLNEEILDFFNIHDQDSFKEFHEFLKKKYEEIKSL